MQMVIDLPREAYERVCKMHGLWGSGILLQDVDTVGAAIACGTPLPNKHDNCGACEWYDSEKHYCPLYCEVIKQTLKELRDADKEVDNADSN